MAQLGGTFDANSVEPSAPIEILPPGNYPVQIIESAMKETSTGGQMLALTLEVIDGPNKGRRLWDNLNLVNSNAQAQDIAQRALSAICHAVGKLQVSDSEELHFKPMMATVKVQPARTDPNTGKQYDTSNRIGGYKALEGAAAAAAAQRPAFGAQKPASGFGGGSGAATAAKPAGAAPPPWKR